MPILNLITNVKVPDAKAFALELSKFAAETLNRPEKYISVIYIHNEIVTFAGSLDPAFNLRIVSLDNLSEQENEGYSKAFFQFFEQKLGTKDDRGYVSYFDPGPANIAYESTTVATIFSKK